MTDSTRTPTLIQVAFFESHEAGIPDGESLPTDLLARFTFDPLHTHAIPEATLPVIDFTMRTRRASGLHFVVRKQVA